METDNKKNVVIYSTATCHFCHAAKDFFNQNNIPFEEIDVTSDEEKRQEMIDLSGQLGVPVIKIDDEIFVGFRQDKLAEALGLQQ